MAADGEELALLQEQLKRAITDEEYEKCAPLRDKIKQAQAALAAKRVSAETAAGAQGKSEILIELEAQLVLAVKLCDFALCISLRDQIKFLKCSACGVMFNEDALSCVCGTERPPAPDVAALTWRATIAGPSTPLAHPSTAHSSTAQPSTAPTSDSHTVAAESNKDDSSERGRARVAVPALPKQSPTTEPQHRHTPSDKNLEVKIDAPQKSVPLAPEKKDLEAVTPKSDVTHKREPSRFDPPPKLAPSVSEKKDLEVTSKPDITHKREPSKFDPPTKPAPSAPERKDPEAVTPRPQQPSKIEPPQKPTPSGPPERKDPEVKSDAGHKIQPLPPREKSPSPRPTPSVLPPASRVVLDAPTRSRNAQAPPLLVQSSTPNLHARNFSMRAPPPKPDHTNQECEDQLWSLLGTLDAESNYITARKYFLDRGRGAFFLLFKDKQALFEATKATFQYNTQQGLTTHGVYGTDMAAALNNYDPQTQFIGCVLVKQLTEGQPLFLCQLFGEVKTEVTQISGPHAREALEAKLEKRLQQRPTLEQIQKSAIRPTAEEAKVSEEAKKTIWNTLTGFFRWRPKVVELERLNILTTPVCFGITLPQVYARSNLGDGVLVPNIVRKLVGQLRKEDIAQLVGVFRINGDPSLTVELKRLFDFPEVISTTVMGPNDCPICQAAFTSLAELKAHGKEHEGEIPGPNVSKADPHTLAGLLKMFLRELSEPLFPFEMYLPIYEAASSSTLEKVPAILTKLPPINAATWGMILDFLVEVSYHQKTNMMPPRNLAIVMAPNILRLPPKLDTIARFAKDTPHNVAVIEFLIEHRAKELNMVPKGVPPPKPVISASAAKNLLELLPPLLPPVDVPTAEVQALSSAGIAPVSLSINASTLPAVSIAALPTPLAVIAPPTPSAGASSLASPRVEPAPPSPRPEAFNSSFPPPGRHGPAGSVRPPSAPPKPLVSVLTERKLPTKTDGPDSESGSAEKQDSSNRRVPVMLPLLEKSSSSSNMGHLARMAPGSYKTLPPARPANLILNKDKTPANIADSLSPSVRNVRPPMPPPR